MAILYRTLRVYQPWWTHAIRIRCLCGQAVHSRQFHPSAVEVQTRYECDECGQILYLIDENVMTGTENNG